VIGNENSHKSISFLLAFIVVGSPVLIASSGFSQESSADLQIRNIEDVEAAQEAVDQEGEKAGSNDSDSATPESTDEVLSAPWIAQPKNVDPCYGQPDVPKLKAMANILRNQRFAATRVPTDLMLRCNERSVDVGLKSETREQKVKTSNFNSKQTEQIRALDLYIAGGSASLRYGLQLERIESESSSSFYADGAANSPESGSVDSSTVRIESAWRLKNISVGAFLLQKRFKTRRKFNLAGRDVNTSGERIDLMQPGMSLDLKLIDTQITLGRVQAAEETKKAETVRLPWTSFFRVIKLLEQDQGFRLQYDRSGAMAGDNGEFNRGLLAYFLSIDNATVDVAWFGRSRSYTSKSNATGNQLAAFGFAASAIWQFTDYTELFLSVHSLSANDSLGGTDRRSAHNDISGGQVGMQYVF